MYIWHCVTFITLRLTLSLCCFLHCALSLAAQCIVIGPVFGGQAGVVCGGRCLWVCYRDNSKLRASICTKLVLSVKVVTVSSWLNYGHPAPPGRGSAAGRNLGPPIITFERKELSTLNLVQTYTTEPPCVRTLKRRLNGRAGVTWPNFLISGPP